MKSNAVINVTIAVTCVAIITVMVGLASSLIFRTQINSPIYYGVVFFLTFVIIVLAVSQILPRLSGSLWLKGTKPAPPPADTESDIDDLAQQVRIKLWKAHNSQKNFEMEGQQNLPARVTMEVEGTPITIESPDATKVESIVKLLIHDFQTPIRTSAETKIQPGIIREDRETYQIDDAPEQS